MLSAIVGQLGRKLLLVALTGVMAVSGTIVVIAPIYEIFMVGRALIGIVIGGFWSVSVAIAMRLVPGMPSETMFSRAGGAGSSALAARPRPSPRVARAWSDGPGNRECGSPKTRNLHKSRRCPAFFDGRPVHRLIGEFFGLDGRGRGGTCGSGTREVSANGSGRRGGRRGCHSRLGGSRTRRNQRLDQAEQRGDVWRDAGRRATPPDRRLAACQ